MSLTPEQALSLLAGEVERYLDRPGCNIPARQTAFARLRWALEQAQPRPAAKPALCERCAAELGESGPET